MKWTQQRFPGSQEDLYGLNGVVPQGIDAIFYWKLAY